jgi:AcrR family transcriptional regulator
MDWGVHMEKEKLSGPQLKGELIEVAGQLFHQNGYSKTSVQDIVDAVGVTKGSFYYYFQGKEDLLFLIHDEYISRILKVAREVESNPNLSCAEKLKKIVFDIVNSIGKGFAPNAKVFFQEIKHLKPEHLTITKKKRKEYQDIVTNIIREGIQFGEFRKDLDPQIVALSLFGMCNWTYQWMKPGGQKSTIEIADTFIALLLDGLTPK